MHGSAAVNILPSKSKTRGIEIAVKWSEVTQGSQKGFPLADLQRHIFINDKQTAAVNETSASLHQGE